MNHNKNIPAYTILEVIIGLVVTAIVLSIVFVVFSILSGQLADFKHQNEVTSDINRINYSLDKAIFESEKIEVHESNILFTQYSGRRIKYMFNESYCVMYNNDFIDTFRVATLNIKTDTLYGQKKINTFQRLTLWVNINGKETDLNFYKRLYADELLKSNKNEF